MNLALLNDCFGYLISGGDIFQWYCFGPNARFLDYETETAVASVVFDCKNQTVYQVYVDHKIENEGYVWFNPNFIGEYIKESSEHNIHYCQAYDDINRIEINDTVAFLDKASKLFGTYK